MTDTIRFPFYLDLPAPIPGVSEIAEASRVRAAELAKRKEESFRRCDTDGALSQWGDGLCSLVESENARIAENGGFAVFSCLVDAESGEPIRCALKESKFGGTVWLLGDAEAEKYGRRFIPSGKRSRIQKELGLREGRVFQPAYAKLTGSGTGISGSVWCETLPTTPELAAQ